MSTLLIAVGSFVGYFIAYHTYGRWLSQKIFNVDPHANVPSKELRDDVDFVPTKKEVIFGHHFTSIAGTGPIVGPAIAVFWGWLPALLWVLFGAIFIGAVHDFGALIISMRNRGQTVGEIAGRMITPRARVLFLLILFFSLTIVLAIFGLVIANIFTLYPASVFSVWIAMPVAMFVGWWVYRRGGNLTIPSIAALIILYGAVYLGAEGWTLEFTEAAASGVDLKVGQTTVATGLPLVNPTIAWTIILMIYCFLASVLPVWLLLQPRDFVNSHQLLVALALLLAGIGIAGFSGKADIAATTPAVIAENDLPANAPLLFPFLFITIACGACSGFHCLVSSGTTSKQVASEEDAQYVAYGSMLLEGGLAVIVILACTAGVGMGAFSLDTATNRYNPVVDETGAAVVGHAAWASKYHGDWNNFQLKQTVGAFVEGGANFLSAIGIPLRHGVAIIATLVACFAATTLDSATRLQRYVVHELGTTFHIKPLADKYVATGVAVGLGLLVALLPGPNGVPGTGGLILWPLFGAINQLLAGLAFMVVTFYLWRRNKPVLFIVLPMLMMLFMPAWALLVQMFADGSGWIYKNWLLFGFGATILALQVWMVIEGALLWPKIRGVVEEPLPPLPARPAAETV